MGVGPSRWLDLTKNVAAGGVAQVFGFLLLAYSLANYSLSEYGRFAVVNTVALIVSPVSGFRIEIQALRATPETGAMNYGGLALVTSIACSTLLGAVWWMVVGDWLEAVAVALATFGYYVFGLTQMTNGAANKLHGVAWRRIVQGVLVLVVSVLATLLLGARASSLMIGTAVGFLVASIGGEKLNYGKGWLQEIRRVRTDLRFHLKATATSLLSSGSLWVIVPALGSIYGMAAAGQFSALSRLTSAPANMLVQAGSSMFLAGWRSVVSGYIASEVRRNFIVAAAVLPPSVAAQVVILQFVGASELTFSNNEAWLLIIALLIVALAQAAVSPVIQSLLLSGRATAQLVLDGVRGAGLLALLAYSWVQNPGFAITVFLFALIQLFYYAAAFLACIGRCSRKAAPA